MTTTAPGAPLLTRSFWALMMSSAASNLADGVFRVAVPLLAVLQTRSPLLLAGVQLTGTAPWLLFSLHAGALVDRWDRRRVMVAANTARVGLVGVGAAGFAADAGSIWLLAAVSAGVGVAEVFYDTAAQSILPAVVDRSQLDRANSRLQAVGLTAQELIGPPLAGLLVAATLVGSFGLTGLLWAAALLLIAAARGRFTPERRGPATSLRGDIREGLTFLVSRPVLRTMALMVGMMNFASNAFMTVFVLHALDPVDGLGLSEPRFGLLLTSFAVGGITGSVCAGPVQRRLGQSRSLTLGVVGTAAFPVVVLATDRVAVIGLAFAVSGATTMVWNVATVSYRQRATPDHLLGRLNSAYRLLAWGTRPAGIAVAGVVGEAFGLRVVFALAGLVAVAALVPGRLLTPAALAAGSASEEGDVPVQPM